MSSANRKVWVIRGAVIFACSLGCFFIGRETAKERGFTEVVERVDTLFIRDTITHERPVYRHSETIDTMYVHVHDTIVRNDTTYIPLPRESRTYGDDRYTAVVSGYQPSLDRLEIYMENQTITRYAVPKENPKRWGIGVQVGYGATARDGSVYLSPYIGIGISYDIIRW
jgi:hypothetical protein